MQYFVKAGPKAIQPNKTPYRKGSKAGKTNLRYFDSGQRQCLKNMVVSRRYPKIGGSPLLAKSLYRFDVYGLLCF